jgi:DNA-directed RNA polymerase subunit RPC12/RpoP
MQPLRKCIRCGIEANTKEELELFSKSKTARYSRRNICKECNAARYRQGNEYGAKTHERTIKNRAKHAAYMREYNNPKLMRFKREQIVLKKNPRTNVCSKCGRRYPEELPKQTAIHHDHYDPENPTANTRELCNSCHSKLHYPLKSYQYKAQSSA